MINYQNFNFVTWFSRVLQRFYKTYRKTSLTVCVSHFKQQTNIKRHRTVKNNSILSKLFQCYKHVFLCLCLCKIQLICWTMQHFEINSMRKMLIFEDWHWKLPLKLKIAIIESLKRLQMHWYFDFQIANDISMQVIKDLLN